MPDVILHHYQPSPFSEKIRLLLGYKGVDYNSVIIPMIMPKPDLMPLTGGYRKTPVMQIGADVYCDSAIIAKVIDRLYPAKSVFPTAVEAVAGALAHWTDTFFFKVAVAVVFQPKALAGNSVLADPALAAAFAADRAELSKGSSELRMPYQTAEPYLVQHLKRLDNQLGSGAPYLFGDAPVIADFSTYHCLWFVNNTPSLRPLFEPFAAVMRWMEEMAGLGRARAIDMTGAAALDIAAKAKPDTTARIAALGTDGVAEGDIVEVMPIDYGFNPVRGRVVVASLEELAVLHHDARVGDVVVHFPRLGFQIRKAA